MNIAHIPHPGSKRSITFKYWLLIDNMIEKEILLRLRRLKLQVFQKFKAEEVQ